MKRPSEGSFAGKIVVVTGGSRGIGAACARGFAAEGGRVAIASRSQDALDATARSIERDIANAEIMVVPTDVADESSVEGLFRRVDENWGPVDVLVNNAGVIAVHEVVDLDVEVWDLVLGVNLRGAFLCSREAFRSFRDRERGGAIVNVSSYGGLRGTDVFPGFSAYTVSKFGVVGLTECLSVEGRPLGVRVNCVAPGAVDTEMLRSAAPFLKTETVPEDVAEVILYLADDVRARSLTGTTVEIRSNL